MASSETEVFQTYKPIGLESNPPRAISVKIDLVGGKTKMASPHSNPKNLLAEQTSAYLRQHKDNPVNWYPWGEAAFSAAKQSNKPILLSIGYAACHWCHVMAHECFEDKEVAELMNADFINVKVDREELPDVDTLYMSALHALGEQGGWPLTMFIDPQGAPIWGGTYFPKYSQYGRPGFMDVLAAVHKSWNEDPERISHNTQILLDHLKSQNTSSSTEAISDPNLQGFAKGLLEIQDIDNGGMQGAPKFPNSPILEVLWSAGTMDNNNAARDAFLKTITALSKGGIYDHIGGGLARYCVDNRWLVPHFEKMLYDNAHYLRHLSYAYSQTNSDLFRFRIEETIDGLLREMRHDEGAFYSSLDADSEGEEGKFYVWTKDEVEQVLGDEAEMFCALYDISENGNWEGKSIPNLLGQNSEGLSDKLDDVKSLRTELLKIRAKRIRPGLDDKILADWNGMLIEAICMAADVLDRPDWIYIAEKAFHFCTESMSSKDGLSHAWGRGHSLNQAYTSDYAALINAGISLIEAGSKGANSNLLNSVQKIATDALEQFVDPDGSVYMSANNSSLLPVRTLAHADDANPSPASELLRGLVRLSAISSDPKWTDAISKISGALNRHFRDARYGQAGYYSACYWTNNLQTIVLVGEQLTDWKSVLRKYPRSARVVLTVEKLTGLPTEHIASAAKLEKTPAALICQNQTCSLPIADLEQFEADLCVH